MSAALLAPQGDKGEATPACFMAGALSPQSLVINEAVALRVFVLPWTRFRTGTLSCPVQFVNLAAGRTNPVSTDISARARSGHEALRAKEPRHAHEGGQA